MMKDFLTGLMVSIIITAILFIGLTYPAVGAWLLFCFICGALGACIAEVIRGLRK